MLAARLDCIFYCFKDPEKSIIKSKDPSGVYTRKWEIQPKVSKYEYIIVKSVNEAVKLFKSEALTFLIKQNDLPSDDIDNYKFYIYIYPIINNRFTMNNVNLEICKFDKINLK